MWRQAKDSDLIPRDESCIPSCDKGLFDFLEMMLEIIRES